MSRPVLILGPAEPPIGGVSRYCTALASLLREQDAGVVQVDITRRDGAVLRRILGRPPGSHRGAFERALRRHRPGLVVDNHQLAWHDPGYATVPARRSGAHHLLAIHDGAFPGAVDGLSDASREGLVSVFDRLDGVVCMSDPIRSAVVRLNSRVRTIRLDPLLAAPSPKIAGRPGPHWGFFERHRFVVSASGALVPIYGLEDLLDAFGLLRERGLDIGLLLLLGGFARDAETAAGLDLAKRRFGEDTILALHDEPDGSSIIGGSDLYVRTSRIDSFALGIHEAILAGVPVVASDHPTRPSGILRYPPGDVAALAARIELGLRPETRSAAARLVAPARAALEENRRRTVEAMMKLTPAPETPVRPGA